MIEIPIIGSIALGLGTVLERTILKSRKISVKFYQTASFFAIIISLLPILYFFWKLDAGAFELKNVLIFIALIISAVTANLFIFYSEKREKITNLEPARILEPLFVILLAILFSFFAGELFQRDIRDIIPALIAALALIFPYIKKEHLAVNKYIIAAVLGSFFFALELVLSNLILQFYSPVSFYFFRCLSIFIISLVLFRPSLKPLKDKRMAVTILITGAVWVIYRIAVYFGYLNYGIIFTTLVTMLGPVFVYLFAKIILKEKLNWKNMLSSAVIIGCILYALFV